MEILDIIGWIVFLVIIFLSYGIGSLFAEAKFPNFFRFVVIYLIAIISKIFWIDNIWVASGIWLIVGAILGFGYFGILVPLNGWISDRKRKWRSLRQIRNFEKNKRRGNIKELIRALDNHQLEREAAIALANIGEQAIKPLTEILLDRVYGHFGAAFALSMMGHSGVRVLTEALQSNHKSIQLLAAEMLGDAQDPLAVDALVNFAHSVRQSEDYFTDPDLRKQAQSSLYKICGNGHLAERLLDIALSDPKKMDMVIDALPAPSLLVQAVEVIGAPARNRMIYAVDSDNSEVRILAMKTLGLLKDNELTKLFLRALDDSNNQVRLAAAVALAELKHPASIRHLIEMLQSEDSEERLSAASVLGQIGDYRAIDPLIEMLKNPRFEEKSAAAKALRQLGDRRAVAPLIEMLNSSDPIDLDVASLALGGIKDKKGVDALVKILTTWFKVAAPVARVAMQNPPPTITNERGIGVIQDLGNLGDSRATKFLLKVLKGGNREYDPYGPDYYSLPYVDDNLAMALFEAIGKLTTSKEAKKVLNRWAYWGAPESVRDAASRAIENMESRR